MSNLTAVTLRWSRTANQSAAVGDTWTAIISKKLAAGSRNKGSRPWCEEPPLTPQVSSDRTRAEFGSGRIYEHPPSSPVSGPAGFVEGGGNLPSWKLRPGCFSRKTTCRGIAACEVTHGSCFCTHGFYYKDMFLLFIAATVELEPQLCVYFLISYRCECLFISNQFYAFRPVGK